MAAKVRSLHKTPTLRSVLLETRKKEEKVPQWKCSYFYRMKRSTTLVGHFSSSSVFFWVPGWVLFSPSLHWTPIGGGP